MVYVIIQLAMTISLCKHHSFVAFSFSIYFFSILVPCISDTECTHGEVCGSDGFCAGNNMGHTYFNKELNVTDEMFTQNNNISL